MVDKTNIPELITRKKHIGAGHRKRLRDRFLQSGLDGFLDYEIIELLLTLGTPRRDCKQMAKDAIKQFGKLGEVLDASSKDLVRIKGIGPSNIFGLKLFQAVSERLLREQLTEKITLDNTNIVADYLRKVIGREKKEHFVMLCLDSRGKLINVCRISIGSLNESVVHPREVFKEAVQQSAAQIIICHNHPSENLDPSPEDIALTRRLQDAAKIIGIELLDHLIVTKNKFSSLKQMGMM